MTQRAIESFRDLREEVILRGLCGKCGGCVSFCTAGTLNALEMGKDGFPRYADEEKCMACGICYMICPETRYLDEEVRSRFGWTPPIGTYQTITSARATDEAVRKVATDGGVVTSLLLYMLVSRLISGAVVSQGMTPFSREPVIAATRGELIAAAGSHFAGSSHLEELGDRYTTYSRTLSLSYIRSLIAMVGTPCQIKMIRKMQCLGISPADIVGYTIGLFCAESFSFNAQALKRLETRFHFDFSDVNKLNVKEALVVTLSDGTAVHVPLEELDELACPACLACTEFANDYADISVGGLGSPDGYTTVLVRTEKGRAVYGDALRQGYIEERKFMDVAQLRSEKARMMSKVVAFARWKRERGERQRRELGVARLRAPTRELANC
jgi:coenzyme F420 hydrogenase subunit beta